MTGTKVRIDERIQQLFLTNGGFYSTKGKILQILHKSCLVYHGIALFRTLISIFLRNLAEKLATMKFTDCTISFLEKQFTLNEIENAQTLVDWIAMGTELSNFQNQSLIFHQKELKFNLWNWNEQELSLHFIGPIVSLAEFSTTTFNIFAQRNLAGIVNDIELSGKPDGIIAKGRREPEIPYFCFQAGGVPQYKKELDPDGHPLPQVLGAMLVGQTLNKAQQPMYGCYIIGKMWTFVVLEGKNYCTSESYDATSDEIFTIFKTLLNLKKIIKELVI